MNLRQFFEMLPKDGWYFFPRGRGLNRDAGGARCQDPVSSLAGEPWSAWENVARREKLPEVLSSAIAAAADGACRSYSSCSSHHPDNLKELRRRLLEHCGLQEP